MSNVRTAIRISLTCACVLAACSVQAAMSANLVTGGDFENTAHLKTTGTPDGVPTHRFSQQYDLGKWLAKWGPPSQGGFAGFGLYDNPRNLAETGGDTQADGDLGCLNRSVDPLNAGNHILEVDMFRPRWGQWIAAPANHTTGTVEFSFDVLVDHWESSATNFGNIWLMGLNQLPTHDVSYCTDSGEALAPLGGDALELDGTAAGDVLLQHAYGEWRGDTDPNYLGNWHHIALSTTLTQTYPYYVIIGYSAAYAEDHTYFWLYGGKITDTFAQGFDNFDVRVSLANARDPFGHCDLNLDGLVNVQDINPFIQALSSAATYKTYISGRLVTLGFDNSASEIDAVYAEVDPNQDGVINVQDINHFIAHLASGGVDTSNLIIPEPASLSLLALGALTLLRRQR